MTYQLLALCLTFQVLGTAGQQSVVKMAMPNDDKGIVENCGQQEYAFDVYWEPKDINPEGKVTLTYNFTLPYDFSSGNGTLQLYLPDVPDPIIELTQPINCEMVQQYTPAPCPAKKGAVIVGSLTERKLDPLAGYKGDYGLQVMIQNEQKATIFCGKLKVRVL